MNKICKEFGLTKVVLFSSIMQVYLRENHADMFFFAELPFLIPGYKEFKNIYLPQKNVIDDLIVFMRDGLFNKVDVPHDGKIPIIPVDYASEILLKNVINSNAMTDNLFICNLT